MIQAICLWNLKESDKALALLLEISNEFKDQSTLNFEKGACYFSLSKYEDSVKSF